MPMLLIHGFASGVGLFCKNLDSLSETRRVYAFDLLGFGRSSRPHFPETAEEVENKFVEVIEEWRKHMDLDKFILLGHSMGGFLATSYALSYPERVVHLVLIDPWGFVGQDETAHNSKAGVRDWFLKKLTSFRALAFMRMMGPFGLNALRKMRQDFEPIYSQSPPSSKNTNGLINDSSDISILNSRSSEREYFKSEKAKGVDIESLSPYDPAVVYNYIYHINCRHPTGEDAFRNLCQMPGWAARPMLPRIAQVATDLPITFIYGGRSWVDMSSGLQARTLRPNSYVDVMVIEGGGHHAYAQYADDFNSYVNAIASLVDEGHVFVPGSEALVQEAVAKRPIDYPSSSFE
nr:abhydrolase domain containing protein [Hymenolepis microstoma]